MSLDKPKRKAPRGSTQRGGLSGKLPTSRTKRPARPKPPPANGLSGKMVRTAPAKRAGSRTSLPKGLSAQLAKPDASLSRRLVSPEAPPQVESFDDARVVKTQADQVLERGESSLLDVVDNLLNQGVVLSGDAVIGVADVDLVYLRLQAVLAAADKILKPGTM